MPSSFDSFIGELLKKIGTSHSNPLSISEVRAIISEINGYFYTNYPGIGYTTALGDQFEYFSEFHKFWEKNHRDILDPKIDDEKCEVAADILHDVLVKFGDRPFDELYDTASLTPQEICRIRYFSANQDFRGSRDFGDLIKKHKADPSIFDETFIASNPEDFLKNIGITSLSQNDKRVKYATTAAQLLIDNKIEPYDLLRHCNNDLEQVRNTLVGNKGSGFGNKKTDMFLRDMVVLKVWDKGINFDKIDVASDINTIKVALRTGILKTQIVLVSSFLDIFCHQYSVIDQMNARAWRRVWEIWNRKYPKECIASPSLIDYFIYRIIGKDFCRETLCLYECETAAHQFKWHSSRNKTCQVCYKKKVKAKAKLISKILPCTDTDGYIAIENSEFVAGTDALLPGIKECPFAKLCSPQSPTFRKLNAPKSISILGQTGWESAKATRDTGGGGLMS